MEMTAPTDRVSISESERATMVVGKPLVKSISEPETTARTAGSTRHSVTATAPAIETTLLLPLAETDAVAATVVVFMSTRSSALTASIAASISLPMTMASIEFIIFAATEAPLPAPASVKLPPAATDKAAEVTRRRYRSAIALSERLRLHDDVTGVDR